MTEPTRTYCNPICVAHPGSSRDDSPEPLIIGDPYVLRHDGEYFLYGTTDPSTGFRVFRSNDLVTWVEMGFALQSNADTWGGPPFWAPEVLAHRGRFYMTYSASDASTGLLLTALAVADNPLGPFTDLHCPWFDLGYSAIDTHLFVDDEDVYAFFSRNGEQDGYSFGVIYGAPVAQDLSGLSDAPRVLLQAD